MTVLGTGFTELTVEEPAMRSSVWPPMSSRRRTRAHLVMIGLGSQAADQLSAVREVRAIRAVTLVGQDLTLVEAFRVAHRDALEGLEVSLSADVDEAVEKADSVCCATPSRSPLFAVDSLQERVNVKAIGACRSDMRELPDEVLAAGRPAPPPEPTVLKSVGLAIQDWAVARVLAEEDSP